MSRRFDRILTGTAIALVLGLGSAPPVLAMDETAVEAAVPMPEPANIPPPSAADVGGPTTGTTGTAGTHGGHPSRSPRTSLAHLQGRCRTGDPACASGGTHDGCDADTRHLLRFPPWPLLRSGNPRCAARSRWRQQARPHCRPQDRPHRGRGVLFLARLRADLGRPRWHDRTRQTGDPSPAQFRCRRHGPRRLSGARCSGRRGCRPRWRTPK